MAMISKTIIKKIPITVNIRSKVFSNTKTYQDVSNGQLTFTLKL